MSKVQAYNLKLNKVSSNQYYEEVNELSINFLDELLTTFDEYLEEYVMLRAISSHETPRTKEEYSVEILMIGVLWNLYINNALACGKNKLMHIDKVSIFLKNYSTAGIYIKARRRFNKRLLVKKSTKKLNYSLQEFECLLSFMNATHEFREVCNRLYIWESYMINLSVKELSNFLILSSNFANKFIEKCDNILGQYFVGLHDFVVKCDENKLNNSIILNKSDKPLYYLNMVGAQILNNIYIKDFAKSNNKIILLPRCMILNKSSCKANHKEWAESCSKCTFNCPINKACRELDGYNVEVCIEDKNIDMNKAVNVNLHNQNIGIVKVTCVLNMLSDIWRLKSMCFIPQCIAFDSCGCQVRCNSELYHKSLESSVELNEFNFEQLINTIDNNNMNSFMK